MLVCGASALASASLVESVLVEPADAVASASVDAAAGLGAFASVDAGVAAAFAEAASFDACPQPAIKAMQDTDRKTIRMLNPPGVAVWNVLPKLPDASRIMNMRMPVLSRLAARYRLADLLLDAG